MIKKLQVALPNFLTSPVQASAYRPDIDGLRALAILAVVGYHYFPAWFPGGFAGVDIFFVISGYLITGILLSDLDKDRFSIATFYARRIRRIFPALLVVLAACMTFAVYVLWPGELKRLGKHVMGGAGFVVNLMLAGEHGYFDSTAETKPLLHLWSLGVEEQFYIVWPLLLALAWKCRCRAYIAILSVMAASLALSIWHSEHVPVWGFYSPLSRFWELGAGAALAWAHKNSHPIAALSTPLARDRASQLGFILLTLSVFFLNRNMPFPGWRGLLPVVGAMLIIAAGSGSFVNRLLLSNKAMVGIGLVSFPWYLWHWPLISFTQIMQGEPPSRKWRFFLVLVSLILATLTYLVVERPVRTRKANRELITILATLMFIAGGTGGYLYINQGLPQRFSGEHEVWRSLDTETLITDWQQQVRMGTCHLQEPDQTAVPPECIESKRPLVLLWGDSHAAALYPGLKAWQSEKGFGLIQHTQAGCPPLMDIPRLNYSPKCNDINRNVMDLARREKPELIILASAWTHDDYPMDDDSLLDHLRQTVKTIHKASPKSRIAVIGPVPRWLSPLPAIYRRGLSFGHEPPMRTFDHANTCIGDLNAKMADLAQEDRFAFLSIYNLLCTNEGCLTRFDDSVEDITFIDEDHLSPKASRYVIDKLKAQMASFFSKSSLMPSPPENPPKPHAATTR